MRGKMAIQKDYHICGLFDEAFGTRDVYRFGLHLAVEIACGRTPKIVIASKRRGAADRPHQDATLRELGDSVVQGGFNVGGAFSGDGTGVVMVNNLGTPIHDWHRQHILSTRRGCQPDRGQRPAGLAAQSPQQCDEARAQGCCGRFPKAAKTRTPCARGESRVSRVVARQGSISPNWLSHSVAAAAKS